MYFSYILCIWLNNIACWSNLINLQLEKKNHMHSLQQSGDYMLFGQCMPSQREYNYQLGCTIEVGIWNKAEMLGLLVSDRWRLLTFSGGAYLCLLTAAQRVWTFVRLLRHLKSRLESECHPRVPWPRYSRKLSFQHSKPHPFIFVLARISNRRLQSRAYERE